MVQVNSREGRWVDTTMLDGGRRVVQHGSERLVLGFHRPPPEQASPMWFSEETSRSSLAELSALFQEAGAHVEIAADMDVARWRKVLWCAPLRSNGN